MADPFGGKLVNQKEKGQVAQEGASAQKQMTDRSDLAKRLLGNKAYGSQGGK